MTCSGLARVASCLPFCLFWARPHIAQDRVSFGGVQSFGVTASYSPDSSHILIGEAEQRRIWTLGVEYTHRLTRAALPLRLRSIASCRSTRRSTPPWSALIYTVAGQTTATQPRPSRARHYGRSRPRRHHRRAPRRRSRPSMPSTEMRTPTQARSRRSARAPRLFQHHSIQPSFSLDLGFVVATRDIPMDDSDQFNYMFSFGPGVQFYTTPAGLHAHGVYLSPCLQRQPGNENPGVDQGTFRVTISRR